MNDLLRKRVEKLCSLGFSWEATCAKCGYVPLVKMPLNPADWNPPDQICPRCGEELWAVGYVRFYKPQDKPMIKIVVVRDNKVPLNGFMKCMECKRFSSFDFDQDDIIQKAEEMVCDCNWGDRFVALIRHSKAFRVFQE